MRERPRDPEARRIAALVVAGLAVVGAAAEILAAAIAIDRSPRTDAAEIDAPFIHISPTTPGRVDQGRRSPTTRRSSRATRCSRRPAALPVARRSRQGRGRRGAVGGRPGRPQHRRRARQRDGRRRADPPRPRQSRARPAIARPADAAAAQGLRHRAAGRSGDAPRATTRRVARQAEAQSSGANQVIGTLETRRAQLAAAQATLALAERDLADTVVRAPFDGRVTGFHLVAGRICRHRPAARLADRHRRAGAPSPISARPISAASAPATRPSSTS